MASQRDPLLPQHEPAPVISSYGASPSRASNGKVIDVNVIVYDDVEQNGNDHFNTVSTTRTITSRAVSLIWFVVICAIVVIAIHHASPQGHQWPAPNNPLRPYPGKPIHPHKPTIEERVETILTKTPLIDGHNDLAILVRGIYQNDITAEHFRNKFEKGGMEAQVDLPRLESGMVGGAFWSAFTVCPEHASEDFSNEQYSTSVAHTIEQIDLLKRLQQQYPHKFTPAGSSLATMTRRFHETRSLFGAISIEGLHQLSQQSGLSTLRLYYELGVRAATLTWNCHNAFADAALITSNGTTKIAPYHRGGLTSRGRQLIKEMNRLGMLVDISHTSYWTQKAVLSNATSRSPVLFTHSSAFELCPHPRNVKNDILDLVKSTNSVVMVNFSPDFISCKGNGVDMPEFYKQNNTLHQAARHIVYIGERIGYDHVGLGSDFDGIQETPEGLDGVDKYPNLIAELLKMGVSDEDAAKVVGENVLRVWKRAEEISQEMKKEGVLPFLDEVHGFSRDEL